MAACGICPLPAQQLTKDDVFVMPAGTIKRIHVNQHIIRQNKKHDAEDPVITVQWRNKSYTAKTLTIRGESTAIYSPKKPLSCGARVWVETTAAVEIDNR